MVKKSKVTKDVLIKYFVYFILLLILRNSSELTSQVFSFGLFFAVCAVGFNIFVCGGLFVVSSLLFGTASLIVACIQAGIVILMRLCTKKFSHKFSVVITLITLLLSQVYSVVAEESMFIVSRILLAVGAVVYALMCMYVCRAVIIRGLKYKLNTDEIIGISVFVVTVFMGLAKINIFSVNLLTIVTVFLLLISLAMYGAPTMFAVACLSGLSMLLLSLGGNMLIVFALLSLVAFAFSGISRRIGAMSMLLAVVCCAYLLKLYPLFGISELIAIGLPVVIYCLISTSFLQRLCDKYGLNYNRYGSRHIVNRQRATLSRKLYDLSEVFRDMYLAFRSMVVGVLPPDKASIAIAREVSESVCRNCIEHNKCWRVNIEDTEKAFIGIISSAIDRGRATILDLNTSLTSRCGRVPSLLSTINQSVATYKQYYNATMNSDNSRLLISEQLNGVSQIMLKLSSQSKAIISYDTEKEKQLIEELTYYNVLVKEAVIFYEATTVNVTIVISSDDINNSAIASTASSVCKTKMLVDVAEQTANPNWVVLHLRQSPKYDVTLGYATMKKNGSAISGDTHTFMRIDRDKFMVAICDGMGSGLDAEKASATAISLVENFYKAGFDNQLILSSVNRLLGLRSEEVFTAVDICVVDLLNGLSDFIKIGCPIGMVKSGNEVSIISGGSLPLGVLEEMSPVITRKALVDNDIIVLFSDGLIDAYPDKEALSSAINSINSTNGQLIADTLLRQALAYCNNVAGDDMTIIVARVFEIN